MRLACGLLPFSSACPTAAAATRNRCSISLPAAFLRLFALRTLLAASCVFSSGCVPWHERYDRVELPNASYIKGLCGGYGPPNWTYYPFADIFISVTLSPLQIGLHYPVGTAAHLDGDTIEIRGVRGAEAVDVIADLRLVIHGALGSATPGRFDGMSDPADPTRTPRYHRSSKGRGIIWESFLAFDKEKPDREAAVPDKLEHGVLVIPPMTINGHSYGAQQLPILHRAYTGIYPINC